MGGAGVLVGGVGVCEWVFVSGWFWYVSGIDV